MQAVGVRELKANLSAYLRRVQAGQRVVVTDRGRAIAALVPAEPVAAVEWAHAAVSRGQAQWVGGKPLGLQTRIQARGTPTSRMVIQDRR